MAAMTGKDFWELLQYILPFFVILLPAYFMAKKKIISTEHAPGLNRWTSLVGVPLYVGKMVAFNDPYKTNLRLVGADALQKVVVLIIACIWWKFSKTSSIDGVISFFMLATLSNMVLVGPALFTPLHGDSSNVSIATIILLQCVLWYNLCIALFEIRAVLKEMNMDNTVEADSQIDDLSNEQNAKQIITGPQLLFPTDSEKPKISLQRSTSAPTRVSFSTARVVPMFLIQGVDEDNSVREGSNDPPSADTGVTRITFDIPGAMLSKSAAVEKCVQIEIAEPERAPAPERSLLDTITIVTVKVLNRIKYAPLLYTSSLGFIYSLFAFKYGWVMPYTLKQSLDLIANGAIGIAVVTMALTWCASGKLIACGWKKMIFGWVVRFVVGPFIMIGTSLIFGLKGIPLEFSILQAALPLGLVSFVLAKEYCLDVLVFSTAVITQLVIFLPVVVIYYFALQLATE